jgi:restriction system protein
MTRYCRIFLGKGHIFAADCREKGFVGVDFDFEDDLTKNLYEDWREFNKEFVPKFLTRFPEKSKVSAGLACGMTWQVCRGLQIGDVVLAPTGDRTFYVGDITGPYRFVKGDNLPHQRPVKWRDTVIQLDDMSEQLRRSVGSIGTTCMLDGHTDELEQLVSGSDIKVMATGDGDTIENVSEFVFEKHLEDFMVKNWELTPFASEYDIYHDENGVQTGQQFSAFGRDRIDILAISKDKKTLLVIELKKGKGTDEVLGQVLRYMGYVNTLKEENQTVKGLIVAHEDDPRIRHALSMVNNVDFYTYKIQFTLTKVQG